MKGKIRSTSLALLLASASIAIFSDALGLFSANVASRAFMWLIVGGANAIGLLPSRLWFASANRPPARAFRWVVALSTAVLFVDVAIAVGSSALRVETLFAVVLLFPLLLAIPGSVAAAVLNAVAFFREPSASAPPN